MNSDLLQTRNENRRSLLRVAALLAQTYGVTVLGLVIGIFSARGLAVEDRGLLALLLLATQMCSRLGSIGFEQVLQRDGARGRLPVFYMTAASGAVLASPVIYLTLRTSEQLLWLAPILMLVAAAVSLLRINVALLIHTEQLRRLALLNLGQAATQLLLYAAVFNTHNLLYFLWVWVANVVLFTLLSVFLASRVIRDSPGTTSAESGLTQQPQSGGLFAQARSLWGEGLQFSGVALSEMALSFCLELPVVRAVLGGTQAGLYSISNTLTGIYFQVFVALSAVAAKRRQMASRRTVYLGMLGLGLVFVVVAGPAITLVFGSAYAGAAQFAAVMLPVTWLLGLARVEQTIAARSLSVRSQFLLFALLVALLLAGLSVRGPALLPLLGMSYTLYAALTLWLIRRYNH